MGTETAYGAQEVQEVRRGARGLRLVGRKAGFCPGARSRGHTTGYRRRGDEQPPRSEEREGSAEKADGAEGGKAKEVAGEGQPIARCGDAVGAEQSDIVKAPSADELEPEREARRAPEAIRKPCATCRVEKETAHFSG